MTFLQVEEWSFDDFLSSQGIWEAALERSIDNNIFLTWEWLKIWWEHYGKKRKFSLVTVMEGQKLLAAAPMMFTNYRLLGVQIKRIECLTSPAADYHAFLLTAKDPEFIKLILEHIKHTQEWDLIELSDVPQESETGRILDNLAADFKLKVRLQDPCPYASLPSNFNDYFQSLSPNLRRNLRKSENKAKKQHKLAFSVCHNVDDAKESIKTFFDLHQKRWKLRSEAGAFAEKEFADFHVDVSESFAKKGWLALSFLSFDDVPVSAGYGFVYRGKLFSYLSGFDPSFSDFRVGNLRLMYLIRNCIDNGLSEYDFLRGAEPYKEQWSNGVRTNVEYWIARKKFVPSVYGRVMKSDRLLGLVRKIGKNELLRQKAG